MIRPLDDTPRGQLLDCYMAALRAVDGRTVVRRWLADHAEGGFGRLVAIGKAAEAMALGAYDALGEVGESLIVTRHGHASGQSLRRGARVIEAGHPLPDAESLRAGEALLEIVDAAPKDARMLFLVSGGASALVESVSEGGLDALRALNAWLLSSGLPIEQMNRIRKAVSNLKGGRMARRLAGRPALVLLLSDVPGDDPAVIGSGMLAPDGGERALPSGVPDWVLRWAEASEPSPMPDDPCFATVRLAVVATNADARRAAAEKAKGDGVVVHHHQSMLTGEAERVGAELGGLLLGAEPGLHLWGGETTVRLPPEPGRGGRCQALALAAADRLRGRDDIVLLAAGTDGSDGPTEDAGALVDGGTCERGETEGGNVADALRGADAGSFLESSGDLIQTGPTGTNVMDLVMALKA